jgi:hypothetical protein
MVIGENMKKTLLGITVLSLVALTLGLGIFQETRNVGLKSPKEWVMMAVEEEEYYQLDDDGYLLTHTVVNQTPSLELVEEAEGDTYKDYLYVKDDDGNYYMAFFKHYLVVEKYGGKIEEYVYISAIAWEDRNGLDRLVNKAFGIKGIYEWQIQDLDIEELE